MKLDFIPLGKLSISKANMRAGKKAPDVSDILPTIRKRGILQPLIVRLNGSPDSYEIVAGRRRFHAASLVHDEREAAGLPVGDAIPCAILDDGDDASAIEASLIENLARLDADEVTQWESFTRLVKEGRTPEDISETFGLPALGAHSQAPIPAVPAWFGPDPVANFCRTAVSWRTLAAAWRLNCWR